MEYALLSPYFTEKFTMSYKLITLMKTHGESVKRKMFTKLQTVFKDMQLLMTGKNFTSDFLQCFFSLNNVVLKYGMIIIFCVFLLVDYIFLNSYFRVKIHLDTY